MNSKVKVNGDAAGNVVVPSKNNPEWGYIRVIQIRNTVDERGWLRRRPVSALVLGSIDDLKGLGWKKDQELKGNVIFKEQMTPFNVKEPEKDHKIAGSTGIICCVDGDPIYRKSFWAEDPESEDVLLKHTNGDDIKAAYAALHTIVKEIDGNKQDEDSQEFIDGNKL